MSESQELVPVDDNIEVLDKVDDDAIINMMTGQAIQDYVYSFKQGGKTVEGLTLAGVNEAANRRGGLFIESVTYEEKDQSWLALAKAVDTVSGNSRYGAYEQSKRMGNREDPHAFTKAIHKAQRNAIKQLLPVSVIKQVLNFYLHPEKRNKQLPTGEAAPNDTAKKSVLACANSLYPELESHSVSKDDLWSYVKRRYNVESSELMTEGQWAKLSAEMQAANNDGDMFMQLVLRIEQTKAAATDFSETPAEDDDTQEAEVL